MKAHTLNARLCRAILDGVLILLLALALAARDEGAQAQARYQAAAGQTQVLYHAPAGPALDNNTLAAMIAAENAALTQPQYLLDLSLMHR
jgi:hypothetical protein